VAEVFEGLDQVTHRPTEAIECGHHHHVHPPALETIAVLRAIQPVRVAPEQPVFAHTRGGPIEPNSLLPHWYAAQRALGIRVRGLYSTKDTFVSTALQVGVKIAWLETQTGVNYITLRRHYGKWMPLEGDSELRRFASVDPTLFQGPNVSGQPRRRTQ
jgi:hypothetical protein